MLVERHSALRTVFVQKDGTWQQKVIASTGSLQATLYDGSHLQAAQRDEQIRNLIQQASQDFRINKWPLLKILVIKVNDSRYDISFIGHHLIGDLLSNGLLFKEFWVIYSQILGNPNGTLPTAPTKLSYSDYLQLLMEKEKQGELASHIHYWMYQFPSEKSALHIPFDHQKGENIEVSAAQVRFTLPLEQSKILLTKAKKHYDSTLYPLLLAPLYRLMAKWSGNSEVAISHRSHGRDLGDSYKFFDSVGNFAVNFPVGIKVAEKESWEQTLKLIKQKFDWLPMNGVAFDWLCDQLPSYMYPDHHLTPIRANYLGNRSIPTSQLFEFLQDDWHRRLSPPEQKRTTMLEFFFSLADGSLQLEIEYSSNFHLPSTINQLGTQYLELMHDLIQEVPVKASINNQDSSSSERANNAPSRNNLGLIKMSY